MRLCDLFTPIPEFQIPYHRWMAWYRNNEHLVETFYHGITGVAAPYWMSAELNAQIKLDLPWFNHGLPIISNAMFTVMRTKGEVYDTHVDRRRCTSLNFFLWGDTAKSRTAWEVDGSQVKCPYPPQTGILFNTQVPHRIEMLEDDERILLTFSVTMGYDRLHTLYREGLLFREQNAIMGEIQRIQTR